MMRQEAQRPSELALPAAARAQSDGPGLLVAVEQLGGRRDVAALSVEDALGALENVEAADDLHRGSAAVSGHGELAINPSSGPSASARSRMRARRTFWRAPLSRFAVSPHIERSSSMIRTIYSYSGMGVPPPALTC